MMHTCDQCGLMSNREIRPDHMVTVECQELADLRAQLAAREAEVGRLREAIQEAGRDYWGGRVRGSEIMIKLRAALQGEG